MTIGLPQVITSDNEKEFRNALDTELSTKLSIQRIFTAPYHPQHHRQSLVPRYDTAAIYVQERFVFAEKTDSSAPNAVIPESLNASTKMSTPTISLS